ncbi:MAG: hypothetical protein EOO03_01370 [Chitinophagaceae bacterium]|nr:MAG: hypothetical protein EOO03_01370 [Chitinophagaceae bacterium]
MVFLYALVRNQAIHRKAIQQQLDTQLKNADADRFALATQLHNDLQPYLTAICKKIEMIRLQPYTQQHADEALAMAEQSFRLSRDLTRLVLPYNVKTTNLPEAIRYFADQLQQEDFMVTIDDKNIPALEQDLLLNVCRLLQEIMYNSIKHSTATLLKIHIRYRDAILLLRTAEEGWRQQPASRKDTRKGVGMELMQSRVRLLNGDMHCSTHKQEGTRYVIKVPVPASQLFKNA